MSDTRTPVVGRHSYTGRMALYLAGEDKADRLLADNATALVIGMVLDQQIPLERAFAAPLELQRRLGKKLTAGAVARTDPKVLEGAFKEVPALHRFPGAMAERVQRVCQIIVDDWGGDASTIWSTAPDGATLLKRLQALPGFGEQKARIFVALLGKQLGCRPKGWRQAGAPYADAATKMSIADIKDTKSREAVRAYKQQRKAEARAAAE